MEEIFRRDRYFINNIGRLERSMFETVTLLHDLHIVKPTNLN